MATNVAGRRYRTWYAMLLRLYPRPFRERFGEGMAQTFHDLCRERSDAKLGLFGLALWIFFETSVGIVRENTTHMPQLGKTMLRVALGALADRTEVISDVEKTFARQHCRCDACAGYG